MYLLYEKTYKFSKMNNIIHFSAQISIEECLIHNILKNYF